MSARRDARPLTLAYRALGLGDLLTGVPALRALRRAHPEHVLALCAPAALAPLARLFGAVDAVSDTAPLAVPDAAWHGAELAVNLHGRGPQSHHAIAAARPRRLIAFRCEAAGHPGPEWRADEHEVVRWCRLLEESGIPADPHDLELAAPPPREGPDCAGATVIHPGAASASRRWPPERWARVARAESRAGRRVVLTGSRRERSLAEEVAAAAGLGRGDVLAGDTDVLGLARVVAGAGRVLCGDTGVGHLATAFGVPSVLLFGPTPPSEWGPDPGRGRHVVLWTGRRGDPHGGQPDPGLLEIGVADVLAACARLPARDAVRPG